MTPDLTEKDPTRDENWPGYTLEDLRYRRAYIAAKRELERERLLHNVTTLRKGSVESVTAVTRRVTSSIPVFNYALMAFGLVSKGLKIVKTLRGLRKKKK